MRRLLISAAEPSGDLLAASLVCALKDREPIDVFGLAGPAMRAAGVTPLVNMEDVCGMGFVEVFQKLGAIQQARATLCAALDDTVDAAVLIDAPDLHLPIGTANIEYLLHAFAEFVAESIQSRELVLRQHFHRPAPRGHGDRVGVVGPPVRQFRFRFIGLEHGHDVRVAGNCADGKAAANDLAECR